MLDADDLTAEQKAILFIVDKLSQRFSIDKLYIQKVVFLITHLLPDTFAIYDYEPNKMGMYSAEVALTIKREEDLGLIEGLKPTALGKEIISSISSLEPIKKVSDILSAVEGLSKYDILYLLYNLYPEFTAASEIKESVDSYKLQSVTIDTDTLKEGQETQIKTDKGNFLVIKKAGKSIQIVSYKDGQNGQT
ncbi:MAG: hypothetical protein QXN16_02420 [Candidatus Micrarchaeaceae archaeon]